MKPNPVHRLPAPLEAAVQRLKMAAREAAERTIESLGLSALASNSAFQRDGLLGAQFELNRKSAVFALRFNDAFDERLLRDLGGGGAASGAVGVTGAAGAAGSPGRAPRDPSDWAALSLVDDKEVEAQISADRFALEVAHACEWELRELDGYVATLLADDPADADETASPQHNPLRPEIVGHALVRGVEAVSDRTDIRKLLASELGRSLGALLRTAYVGIVADLRGAGVQPMALAVRHRSGGAAHAGVSTSAAALDTPSGDPSRSLGADRVTADGRDSLRSGPSAHAPHSHGGGVEPHHGTVGAGSRSGGHRGGGHTGAPLGDVGPALMPLMRRLAHASGAGSATHGDPDGGVGFGATGSVGAAPWPANVIHAHREELRQAANGALDHLVIDLIGFLFDQILADPKVPPEVAREIARLQLPVLRAALGDPGFFSSRRHPVRRFVNRIASLGAAFEDFGDEGAQALLAKVRALVNDVVDGDFDRIDVYEQQLAALEVFTAELAARAAPAQAAAAALLEEKEDELRLHRLYAQRLASELKDMPVPAFLRDFVANVWSSVLLKAAQQAGSDSALVQRLRQAGREVVLSVQPKPSPAHRKAFLAELPRLMQDLTDGMNLVGWPETQRRAFFGQLLPAHAEALKSAGRMLDINLMARQLEGALQKPPPSRGELAAAPLLPVLTDELPQAFSADEAERVGLVDESTVDWDGTVDIELGGPGDAGAADREADERAAGADAQPALPGLPAPAGPPEPTEGLALADHVQVGYAYRMHLEGSWHKVRLAHVSPARGFFLFTHGPHQRGTVSLTRRMLVRLCESGRLKAYESAWLMERATARARRQLAGLGGAGAAATAG